MRELAGATIVFDLDGTLVDTAPDLLRVLSEILAAEGIPAPDAERARLMVGQGARALIDRAARAAGVIYPDARLSELTEAFVETYALDIARESRPFPGVEATLDALSEAGAVACVCTNKRTGLSKLLLSELGLESRFAAIIGADAVADRKPHPSHLLTTIAEAGGAPTRAVMVGDSAADIGAARAAGVPSIAVRFGYCEEGVEQLGADAIIDHYADLASTLRRLLP